MDDSLLVKLLFGALGLVGVLIGVIWNMLLGKIKALREDLVKQADQHLVHIAKKADKEFAQQTLDTLHEHIERTQEFNTRVYAKIDTMSDRLSETNVKLGELVGSVNAMTKLQATSQR